MASVMQMDILSPDAYVLQTDDVSYIEIETTNGGLGIFPHHATMVVALAQAPMKYRDSANNSHYVYVDGGFFEIKENKATILSTAAEAADAIDAARAQAALERAQAKIDNPPADVDMAEVIGALKRAQGRLKTLELAGSRAH